MALFRTYLNYWCKLCLAHFSNWSFAQFCMPPKTLGYLHAKLDKFTGRTKCYYSGLRPLWHQEVEHLLLEKYKVRYVNLNHADHSTWDETYEKSYNQVAKDSIRQKFGVDVVDLCLTTVEYQYRSQELAKKSNQAQISA